MYLSSWYLLSLTPIFPLPFPHWWPLVCSLYLWVCLFSVLFTSLMYFLDSMLYMLSYSICFSLSDISLSVMASKSMHVAANGKISFFFYIAEYYFIVYICCCSVVKSCPTLCNPMNSSMPGFPVLHYLPGFAQTHVHWVSNAIQPSHLLLLPFPLTLSLSKYQGLFQWVGSLHQMAKVLEL